MDPDWRKIEFENRWLSVRSACFLGEGWNSCACLVNDELVFRFPKHQEHWEELEREIAFLAFAADDLPLAVHRYVRVAPDSPAAAYRYAVYRYLRCHAMDANALSREQLAAAAEVIAAFLRTLHSLQPSPEVGSLLPMKQLLRNGNQHTDVRRGHELAFYLISVFTSAAIFLARTRS